MLTVITGPMFSGKTSALISRAISHAIAGDFVIGFKPSSDDRYDKDNIVTHDKKKFPAYSLNPKDPFDDFFDHLRKHKNDNVGVVLFDEIQFLNTVATTNIIKSVIKKYCVIAAGLSQDSFGEPFGPMPHLLSMADNIISLKAVCSKCKKISAATRTFRKAKSKEQTLVGGAENYEPRCFECWNEI